jgi:hypothetical protein
VVVAATVLSGSAQRAPAPYVYTGTVSLGMDGITGLTVDAELNRLYLGHRRGLLWVDLTDRKVRGPLTKIRITGDVDFAPGLGKLFFAVQDAIGVADIRRDQEAIPLGVIDRATDLVYEPTRRELYVFTSTPRVTIIDARSGEGGPTIELPGWFGHNAVAAGGRMFLNLGGHQGIYKIDIDTRRVEPWSVKGGRLVSPFLMQTDPAGKYLFVAPPREIVMIDIAKAEVVARVPTMSRPALAFDPAAGLLLATWATAEPTLRIMAYRVDDQGLTEIASLTVPGGGRTRLESTGSGFIQLGRGSLGAPTLLVWKRPPA